MEYYAEKVKYRTDQMSRRLREEKKKSALFVVITIGIGRHENASYKYTKDVGKKRTRLMSGS